MWDARGGGRGPERNPGANFAHRLPPREHHLAEPRHNSTAGGAGQPPKPTGATLPCYRQVMKAVKIPGSTREPGVRINCLPQARLVLSRCSDVAKVSSALGCRHKAGFTALRIRGSHLLYPMNIKGIALHLFSADQFSVKTALC